MLTALALLLAVQAAPQLLCTTLSGVTLAEGDKMERTEGPDFDVYYVDGPAGQFGVYDGYYAQVSGGDAEKAFVIDGHQVNRMRIDGVFRGYLVTGENGAQNHFFGAVFKGDASDRAFFDRVHFGGCKRAA
ncbi:hypothetical protein [Sphingomonas sp.]|uniref:hypothetical protein n=1 Tax=Sphingomonas sp. TaxID=28214 RepID=UPI001B214D7A|nr:hypothetical protein [Sphingomonas sp.]MBO9714647.1 hypothetical protein [Sphingomonas sp.]